MIQTSTIWRVQVYVHGERWIDYLETRYRSNAAEMLGWARRIYQDKSFRLLRIETNTSVLEVVEDE